MTDGHVRLLPVHVANKIAAGEVVERPASALKELVENSIDAGATRIEIAVASGGAKLISVRDNGCGMNRDDALMSLERQATSKIGDVDDIERISTLGFRGEAIPSIASVSRFTMTTRRHDAEGGLRLTVNAGRLAEISEYGAPPGTQVEVRDLFCNVPARKKFLRSVATEESHVRAVFTAAALAHPDIGFSLAADGRELYRLHPGDTLADRVRSLFGAEWTDGLLAVDYTADPIRVHGFIERPRLGPAIRHEQHVFVNGRPAVAPPISYALKEALPRGSSETRPGCVLFIDLPPGEVDVNVHPAKREVRFRHSSAVREAIMAAIAAAQNGAKPEAAIQQDAPQSIAIDSNRLQTIANGPGEASADFVAPPPQQPPPNPFAVPFSTSPAFSLGPDPYTPEFDLAPPDVISQDSQNPGQNRQNQQNPIVLPSDSVNPAADSVNPVKSPAAGTSLWKTCNILGTLSSGYLILETDAGLVTLNPQAARERIAYEKVMDFTGRQPCQNLLIPEIVTLAPAASQQLRTFLDVFSAMGFAIENMGGESWKVDAVPLLVGETPVGELLPSILADIAESGSRRGGARWREERVSRAVAAAYARFAAQCTPELAMRLVEELSSCTMPYVSPRGKPIMIFTSTRELDRRFGRN